MLLRLRQMLAAPVFADDDEKTRLAGLLNPVLLIIEVLVVLYGISALFTARDVVGVLIQEGSIVLAGLGLIWIMRRGRVRVAAFILCLLLWTIISAGNWFAGGIRGSGLTSHFGVILIAGLLLGGWGGVIFGGLSIVAGVVVLYGERSGLIPAVPDYVDSAYLMAEFGTVAIGVSGLLYLATRSLSRALARARSNETAQMQANRELQTLRDSLEEQVVARTRDLERRSVYLEASAEVSQVIVSILDVQVLIREVSRLLVERFGFSQALIFTVDNTGQWAEAVVGDGELARPLRLALDGDSLVSRCLASVQMQVIEDVISTQLSLDSYILNETRAAALLPLITRGEGVGVLSVESAQPGMFDQDSAALLQTLADLIATALGNARLFEESQQALEAERRAYGEIGREEWRNLLQGETAPGYSYAARQLTPIQNVSLPEVVLQSEKDSASGAEMSVLSIPIEVRGLKIGYVDVVKEAQDGDWSSDDTTLARTITEQLGIALDSARLYQGTQRRAAREQVTREITDNIRAASSVEDAMTRAVREIARVLNTSEAVARLGTEAVLVAGEEGDAA